MKFHALNALRARRRYAVALAPLLLMTGTAQAADQPQSHTAADPAVDELVITATPLRQSAFETAQPASVLLGAELQRQMAVSIGETLEKQLGVTGTYFGPTASRPVIRGLGGERVQVLEDGIGSLDVSALSADHAVTVEPLLADRIEVIKGPATLLYGNAAVGGVVNVLTNRIPQLPADEPVTGAVEVRGNTAADEKSVAGRLDGGAGPIAFHLDAYKRDSDDLDIPGDSLSRRLRESIAEEGEESPVNSRGKLLNTDSESKGGAAGLSYIGERGFIGVGWSRYDTNYGVPGPEVQPDSSGVRIDMSQDRYDLAGELQSALPGISAVRLRASHNEYSHQEFEPSGEPGTLFEQRAEELRLSADHAPLGAWRGTFGAQYRDVRFAAAGEEAFVPGTTTRNAGLFVFEERPLGPLKLEVGARVENQKISLAGASEFEDYDATSLNASAGLLWKYAPEYSVALNVTRTQRHPSATELYANGPHVAIGRFEVGDQTLDKETALTGDLTLRKYAGRVTFETTAFVSRYSDYIFPLDTGEFAGDEEPFPVFNYVQQDAVFYGFEAQVELPLFERDGNKLALRLATDMVRARLSDGGGDVPQLPPWRLGGELTYERDRWQVGVSTYYYADQKRVADNELPTDGYTMVDVDLGYRLPTSRGVLQMFLKGSNLADEEARRHSSPLKDYAPLPGRSLAAGARFEF